MRNIKYLFLGLFYGLILTKGEVISWFRIQEMFRMESIHMYGIALSAIATAAISLWIMRKSGTKTFEGEPVVPPVKIFHPGLITGSLLFGAGWVLTGASPSALYAQIGAGHLLVLVTFISALFGTWVFGLVQKYIDG